jgi:hypothetical protein
MPPGWMSGQVSVSTGNPVSGWVKTRGASVVKHLLYNEDLTGTAHMIFEAAEELDVDGNPVHAEIVEKDADVACGPGLQKTYAVRNCPYHFMRLSASGDPPGYAATLVRGGIEVLFGDAR